MGDAGVIAPSLKGPFGGSTISDGGQEVAAKLEQVVHLAMAGEEPLHRRLSPPRRPMQDRDLVLEAAAPPMRAFGAGSSAWSPWHSPALHRDVEHTAVPVERPPQPVPFAADAQEHLR